jgi:hypothetical protein
MWIAGSNIWGRGYKIEILRNEQTELVEIKQKVLTDTEGQVIKLSL